MSWGAKKKDERKSCSGLLIYYRSAPVYFSSCKQHVTALSSSKAGYIEFSETVCAVRCWRKAKKELNLRYKPASIYEGSNSTSEYTNGGHARNFCPPEHVNVRYHFMFDIVTDRIITVEKLNTIQLLPAFLRNQLESADFYYLQNSSNMFRQIWKRGMKMLRRMCVPSVLTGHTSGQERVVPCRKTTDQRGATGYNVSHSWRQLITKQ